MPCSGNFAFLLREKICRIKQCDPKGQWLSMTLINDLDRFSCNNIRRYINNTGPHNIGTIDNIGHCPHVNDYPLLGKRAVNRAPEAWEQDPVFFKDKGFFVDQVKLNILVSLDNLDHLSPEMFCSLSNLLHEPLQYSAYLGFSYGMSSF